MNMSHTVKGEIKLFYMQNWINVNLKLRPLQNQAWAHVTFANDFGKLCGRTRLREDNLLVRIEKKGWKVHQRPFIKAFICARGNLYYKQIY